MSKEYDKLLRCYHSVREKISFESQVALILGSGLGDYAEQVQVEAVLDYHDIEGFPVSTVLGHKGRFVFGYIQNVPVVIMQGRVHFYEGYDMHASDKIDGHAWSQSIVPDQCCRRNAERHARWRFYADHRSYFQFCTIAAGRTEY